MNETPLGSSGAVDGGGPPRRGLGEQSPLQARAAFLKNWNWELVVSLNRAACERGRAQHGANPQVGDSCARSWEERHRSEISLIEALDFLRSLHQSAPFLFFNGNTFADIGRRTCDVVFADLQATRRRELASAVAHYIAGVLDRDSMVSIVESLCESAELALGDRVQTLRGSSSGTVVRILEDGRVVWKPDASTLEFTGLPESLKRE